MKPNSGEICKTLELKYPTIAGPKTWGVKYTYSSGCRIEVYSKHIPSGIHLNLASDSTKLEPPGPQVKIFNKPPLCMDFPYLFLFFPAIVYKHLYINYKHPSSLRFHGFSTVFPWFCPHLSSTSTGHGA